MSWEERPYADDSYGGTRSRARFGENPLGWSFSIGRVAGIDIRIHFLFLVFIAFELLLPSGGFSGHAIAFAASWLGLLFFFVLLHEFGHCFMARAMGGSAHEVLLWPLGGLAMVQAPRTPQAQFAVAAGGPLVNVLIAAILAPILVAFGKGHSLATVPWNPFDRWSGMAFLDPRSDLQYWLYLAFVVNYALLVFNLFLPMYPFDGGRMLQAAIWPKLGFRRSMLFATTAGMVGAVVLGLLGIASGTLLLVGIAIFGYLTCMNERRLVAAGLIGDDRGFGFDAAGTGYSDEARSRRGWLTRWRDKQKARRIADEREQERQEAEEVDRILLKVHQHGIQSLTRAEKKTLENATARRRGPERMRR